jgi:hypothetical protein
MTRAYALALGAMTQVVTLLPWSLLVGTPGELPHTRARDGCVADQHCGARVRHSPATTSSAYGRMWTFNDPLDLSAAV